jgi:hypothetical protein
MRYRRLFFGSVLGRFFWAAIGASLVAGAMVEVIEIMKEAHWVREIFDWYVERVPQLKIRRRLIEANAPQKGSSVPRRIQWAISSIQAILGAAKEYTFGIKIQTRCGEVFEIPVPPILSKATYQRFLEVRQGNKTHPSHNLKRDYLIAQEMGSALHIAQEAK